LHPELFLRRQHYTIAMSVASQMVRVKSLGWGASSTGDGGRRRCSETMNMIGWNDEGGRRYHVNNKCIPNIWYDKIMLSSFLSCVRQTYDMISIYHITIISRLHPFFNHIMSLSYHAHQTGSKGLQNSKRKKNHFEIRKVSQSRSSTSFRNPTNNKRYRAMVSTEYKNIITTYYNKRQRENHTHRRESTMI
jgi:hypothetical protein